MTEAKQTLRDSKSTRWLMLVILSFTMFAGYLFTEIISPLKPILERNYVWDSADFGMVTSAYGVFNVFFFMLIIVGILLDRLGIRFSTITSVIIMLAGALIKWAAFKGLLPTEGVIIGLNSQVFFAAFGYALFGVGVEYAGITVSKSVVKWFKGKELALAMGMQVAIARLGSFAPLAFGAKIADTYDVPTTIFIGVVFLLIGLIGFLYYNTRDRQLDKQIAIDVLGGEEEKFQIKDMGVIINNRGFWLIAILCVLFYSAVFPFYKYGPDLMVNKFGFPADWAGLLPSLVPFGTMLLTPVFGSIYDKKGRGASIMVLGAILLVIVHVIFYLPFITSLVAAFFNVLLLGIAFSLVPSAMWPSVPKIIPDKQLGSAYALIFWVQNFGLWGIPLLVGVVLNSTNPTIVPHKAHLLNSYEEAYIEVIEESPVIGVKDSDGKTIKYSDIEYFAKASGSDMIDRIVENAPQATPMDYDTVAIEAKLQTGIVDVLKSYLDGKDPADFGQLNEDDDLVVIQEMNELASQKAFEIIKEAKIKLNYDYQKTWTIFVGLTVLALFVSLMLKREDKRKGYGLEKPNIEQEAENK